MKQEREIQMKCGGRLTVRFDGPISELLIHKEDLDFVGELGTLMQKYYPLEKASKIKVDASVCDACGGTHA